MKKIHLLAQVSIMLCLAACSDSKTKTTDVLADSATIKSTVLPSASSLPTSPATVPVSNNGTVSTNTVTPGLNLTAPVTSTPQTLTATGLNPAHGQPGHRCELSVGAPLNSKPNTPSTTAPITTQLSTTPAPVINSNPVVNSNPQPVVATAPGMNPPHGQPGHRCDITVGQPLNSKPTVTTAPTTVVSTPTVSIDTSKKQ